MSQLLWYKSHLHTTIRSIPLLWRFVSAIVLRSFTIFRYAIIYYVHLNLVSCLGVGMVRRPDTSDTLVYTFNGALHLLSGSSVGALEHLKLAVDESGMLVLAADGLLGTVDKLASDEGVANVLDSHKLDLGVLSSNLLQVLVQVLSVLV